jgi:hypothetical protein
MSSTGNDPKTIELKIPQENKEECLKSAKSLGFKIPIPGLGISSLRSVLFSICTHFIFVDL